MHISSILFGEVGFYFNKIVKYHLHLEDISAQEPHVFWLT